MNDRVFLKLAKKVGYPKPAEVAKLRRAQLERSKKGEERSLLDLAREAGTLAGKKLANYERWAEQIAAKAKAALVEEDEDAPPVPGTVSGRIVAQSAEEVIPKDDEPSLDEEIAQLESESRPAVDLSDRTFLKLAKKVGYPTPESIARLRKLQKGRKDEPSLYQLALEEKVLPASKQKNYERWAAQIAAKAKAALVEDEDATPAGGALASGSGTPAAVPAPGTVSGRIIAASTEEVEPTTDEANAPVDELIEKLAPKIDLPDRTFLKLAKRAGYPAPEDLGRIRKLQKARADEASLFRIACEEKVFSAKQQKNYDRWAAQLAQKTKAALVEDEESAAPASTPGTTTLSGRIVVPSADEVEPSGEEAKADLDDLIERFSKKDEPRPRTPSAAKIRTPSAGRERAAKAPRSPSAPPQSALIAIVVVFAAAGLILIGAHSGDSPQETPAVVATETPKPAPKPSQPAPEPEAPDVKGRSLFSSDLPDPTSQLDEKEQARLLAEEAKSLPADEPTAPSTPGEVAKPATPSEPAPKPEATPLEPKPDEPAKKPTAKPAPAPTPAPRLGGPVVERGPDGKVKAKYGTDSQGRKSGDYVAYHENGKPAVRAHYTAGQLQGVYAEFWPNGKAKKKADYRKDKLHGRVLEWDETGKLSGDALWAEGEVIYPRSAAFINAMLSEIEHSPVAAPAPPKDRKVDFPPLDAQTQARPLRRLRQFRWLAGVPWDVDLSFEYGEYATAGAKLLEMIGHLDHTPVKPEGCDESLYETGYKGTSQGNLFMGVSDLVQCIDGWIDDSDKSNVDRVGHRRWCLNPPMKKTAIGQQSAKWTVLHAHDQSRTGFEEPAIVRYPSQGLYPTSFIHLEAAWSVSLSGAKFQAPVKEAVKVTVQPCDERLRKGPPLEMEYFNVNNEGFGQPYCVIFRCKGISYKAGSGYWVEVKGLREADGKPYPLAYYVEFFEPSR